MSKFFGIGIFSDLTHHALYVRGIGAQKVFLVDSIYGRASIKAKEARYGLKASEIVPVSGLARASDTRCAKPPNPAQHAYGECENLA